ncbi:MAG: sulfite exporter TauE/SafE family protein [Nitrospirota bacterium]|nr:MAG: sulfite exporter TauE/SafE family protein [Nitrospirota bacterium]
MKEMYIMMFLTGLSGGIGHCIGMCGPIVAAYSLSTSNKNMTPHLLYNLGRVTTYSLMGGIVGLSGSFLTITGRFETIQKAVMLTAALLIILMGMALAGWIPVTARVRKRFASSGLMNKAAGMFSSGLTVGAYFPMGIVLGFLPCGLVYTALLLSARAGMEATSAATGLLGGASMMLLFGVGTSPALLMFGKIVSAIGSKMRERLYKLSALLMIAMGIMFLIRSMTT